ncbi:MAG TPA: hypothetical protein VF953_00375 [Terriglobales bacterium]|jgi:hypothetical protein
MTTHRRTKLLERTIVLMLLGILIGGLGGAAVGFITGRAPSSSTSQ